MYIMRAKTIFNTGIILIRKRKAIPFSLVDICLALNIAIIILMKGII